MQNSLLPALVSKRLFGLFSAIHFFIILLVFAADDEFHDYLIPIQIFNQKVFS